MEPKATWNDAAVTAALDDFIATNPITTARTVDRAEPWSDDELERAVKDYRTMLITRPEHLNKAKVYRDLAVQIDRSVDSVERRMLNISSILKQHNRPVVRGLNPTASSAQNIGTNVEPRLIALLEKNGLFGPEAQQRYELTQDWGSAAPSPRAGPRPR